MSHDPSDYGDLGSGFSPLGVGDQADGLRRLFAGSGLRFVPVVSNPHVPASGLAVEQLAAAMLHLGRSTLVVDAADTAPGVAEASALGLACCIERLTPQLSYLAARGLPRRYVDTRGCAGRLLDELAASQTGCDVVLLHAEVTDLARIFKGRAARPVLLAADQPDSVKHAYAAWKLLAQRCDWLSADLLLMASATSPRTAHIVASLAQCADSFMGAVLAHWVDIDPLGDPQGMPQEPLRSLAAAQLDLDDGLLLSPPSDRPSTANDAPALPARH